MKFKNVIEGGNIMNTTIKEALVTMMSLHLSYLKMEMVNIINLM